MLLSNYQDNELLDLVKEKGDSRALEELVSRHSGIYISVIQQYSYVPYFERQELLDHRLANIYSYVLDFDPSKGCEFSSFIGNRIRWKCKSLVNKYPEPSEINENICDEGKEEFVDFEKVNELVQEKLHEISDPRFLEIYKLRTDKEKPLSWSEVGKKVDMTHEGARRLFNRNLKKLINKINYSSL